MGDKKKKRKKKRPMHPKKVFVASLVVMLAGAGIVYALMSARLNRVQSAWLFEQNQTPYVAVVDRAQGEKRDYYMLHTFDLDGRNIERTQIGSEYYSQHPSWDGPVDGTDIVVHGGKKSMRLSLLTHEKSSAEATKKGKFYRDRPCFSVLTAFKKSEKPTPENATLAGCLGPDALVRFSGGRARADWRIAYAEASGKKRWALSAKELTGSDEAWFAHGIRTSQGRLMITLVTPNIVSAKISVVVVSDGTGAIEKRYDL